LETAVLDGRRADRISPAVHKTSKVRNGIGLAVYDGLDAVEREWRDLEGTADCTPFQTFGWLATWCEQVGWRAQARPAIVVGRRADGDILFILPLAVMPGLVTRLTFLGSDLCDYNGPLLARDFSAHVTPECFAELWTDIRTLLQDDPKFRHDLIELTKMGAMVGRQPNPLVALPVGLNPSHAFYSDLSDRWESFYEAKRSSATRRRDRTKLKRLGEFGAVSFVTVENGDDLQRTMTVLIEQKARSLARMGAPNIFARPGWSEFYTAAATNPRTRHLVHVSRLDAGTTFAAINLGLVFRDAYYHVLVSHDDGEVARFGPGVAHLRELLRYAIERGLKHFDFTIGDERYKLEWSDHKVPLYDHVATVTWRGLMAKPLVIGHRRLKRFIKQNGATWSAFSRARAALGSKSTAARPHQKSPPLAPE
jgi:CelD/BcsL family acetyltransferase involved in cellulose biosynthesis